MYMNLNMDTNMDMDMNINMELIASLIQNLRIPLFGCFIASEIKSGRKSVDSWLQL
jgi:hypothetical protein